MANQKTTSNRIVRGDEVWSARFFMNNPFEWDFPKLEDYPDARYIIYKLYSEAPHKPVSLMGYVQFSCMKTYDQLNEINMRFSWYKQTATNMTTIQRVHNLVPNTNQIMIKEAVEQGTPWPTKILKRPSEEGDEEDSQPVPRTPSPVQRTPSPTKVDLDVPPPSPPKLRRTNHVYYKKVAPHH
jgi:hypothetical protein